MKREYKFTFSREEVFEILRAKCESVEPGIEGIPREWHDVLTKDKATLIDDPKCPEFFELSFADSL